jgi:hypothetical protein
MLKKALYFLVCLLLILTAFPISCSKNIEIVEKTQNIQSFTVHELIIYIGDVEDVTEVEIKGTVLYKFTPVDFIYIIFHYPFIIGIYVNHITRGEQENFYINKSLFHGTIREGFICGWEHDVIEVPDNP